MPKYFPGSMVWNKSLFKARDEAEQDRAAMSMQKELNDAKKALSASEKASDAQAEEAKKAYDSAGDQNVKMQYGMAYLKNKFPAYSKFIDLIGTSTVTDGIDENSNPYVKYMTKNDSPDEISNNKVLSDFIVKLIESNPDIVDDNNSFIYNKQVHDKVKTLKGDDVLKFLTVLSMVEDKDDVKKYVKNPPSIEDRNALINSLTDQNVHSYDDMRSLIDKWANELNPNTTEKNPQEPEKDQPSQKVELISWEAIPKEARVAYRNILDRTLKSVGYEKGAEGLSTDIIHSVDADAVNALPGDKKEASNAILKELGFTNGLKDIIKNQ